MSHDDQQLTELRAELRQLSDLNETLMNCIEPVKPNTENPEQVRAYCIRRMSVLKTCIEGIEEQLETVSEKLNKQLERNRNAKSNRKELVEKLQQVLTERNYDDNIRLAKNLLTAAKLRFTELEVLKQLYEEKCQNVNSVQSVPVPVPRRKFVTSTPIPCDAEVHPVLFEENISPIPANRFNESEDGLMNRTEVAQNRSREQSDDSNFSVGRADLYDWFTDDQLAHRTSLVQVNDQMARQTDLRQEDAQHQINCQNRENRQMRDLGRNAATVRRALQETLLDMSASRPVQQNCPQVDYQMNAGPSRQMNQQMFSRNRPVTFQAQIPGPAPQNHLGGQGAYPQQNAQRGNGCISSKPPKIQIPKFDGESQQFAEYWAIFETLVHNCAQLTNTEKMVHLINSVEGKASVVIKGIQRIPDNYQMMVNALKRKYMNQFAQKRNIFARLRDMKSGTADNPDELADILDEIRAIINEMTSTGSNIGDSTDAAWLDTIAEKFPPKLLKRAYSSLRQRQSATVNMFLDRMETLIEDERFMKPRQSKGQKGYDKNQETSKPKPSSSEAQQRRDVKMEMECNLCNRKGHNALKCFSVKSSEQREKIAEEKRLCRKCFGKNHFASNCSASNCETCGGRHHKSLCPREKAKPLPNANQNVQVPYQRNPTISRTIQRNMDSQAESGPLNGQNQIVHSNHCQVASDNESKQFVLMTAEGFVKNMKTSRYERVLFFFDSGAQNSWIRADMAENLGLEVIAKEMTTVAGFREEPVTFESAKVRLEVKTAHCSHTHIVLRTSNVVTSEFAAARLNEDDVKFLANNDITLHNANMEGQQQLPSVLIGIDYYQYFVTNHAYAQLPSGLLLAKTLLGYSVYGAGQSEKRSNTSGVNVLITMPVITEKSEQEMVRELFELEGIGFRTETPKSVKEYFEEYKKSILVENGVITCPFPLKEDASNLDDNYNIAYQWLSKLCQSFLKNPNKKSWYQYVFDKYLEEGVIERADNEVPNSAGKYFMPHCAVWRPEKPVPIRVVFNASSHKKGKASLNDVIDKGFSFVRKIHDIMVASRTSPIVISCDIEGAFTQIRLPENQKDLCRFLWVRDPERPFSKENVMAYRFNRLPFGITASPSMLNMAISAFLEQKGTPLAKEILENIYVDNILLKASSVEEALEKYRQSKALFAEVAMNLREYASNSQQFNEAIPEVDRGKVEASKFLGVQYNVPTDEFKLKIILEEQDQIPTKKMILSQLHSIWDPIGIASPLMIELKLIFRKVVERVKAWNEKIPKELAEEWEKARNAVNGAFANIPRLIDVTNAQEKVLWVFADASQSSLATCAYVQADDRLSSLISGKMKLAPSKRPLTVPQLELSALLMAAELTRNVSAASAIGPLKIRILSDSLIALCWLKTKKKVNRIVEGRIGKIKKILAEIEEMGHTIEIFHIPTHLNVADIGTRGLTGEQLNDSDWVQGPKWLVRDQEKPLTAIEIIDDSDLIEENQENKIAANNQVKTIENPAINLINVARFSNYRKLIGTVATAMKGICRWVEKVNGTRKQKIELKMFDKFTTGEVVTSQDWCNSEMVVIKQEQSMRTVEDLLNRHSDKRPFVDEMGIVRLRSRLNNSELSEDTKFPILLPKQSELTRLLIEHLHKTYGHAGKDHLLSLLRNRFHVVQPSAVIKRCLRKCVTCKKVQGLPLGAPDMPALPTDRVVISRPFASTGIDCLGPIMGKDGQKYYVCLYTCMRTRAVHLEPLTDMSAGTFLKSFQRFVSRRGIPSIMRSDQGSNFQLGEKVISALLKESLKDKDGLMTYSAENSIKWIFNVPGAPWMGGAWERLVGTVKLAFKKAVGRQRLGFEDLCTVLAQVEALVNTRPLTKISPSELDYVPLRPIDFLQGNLKYSLPDPKSAEDDDEDYDPDAINTVVQAREAYDFSEKIARTFWQRWKEEYLVSLRDLHKFSRKQPRHGCRNEPQVGEIVLVHNELLPRGAWMYGKIEEIIQGKDKLVRSAKVRLPNRKIIHRPLNKLYPLEIRAIEDSPAEQLQRGSKEKAEEGTETVNEKMTRKIAENAVQADQNLEESDSEELETETKVTRMPKIANVLLICLFAVLISPSSAMFSHKYMDCKDGFVRVLPMNKPFALCYDTFCHSSSSVLGETRFPLPIKAAQRFTNVTMRTAGAVHSILCELPKFCNGRHSLMSKSLLGNPQCWPEGAILSLYLIMYICLLATYAIGYGSWTVWSIIKTKTKRQTNSSTVVTEIEMRTDQPSPGRERVRRILNFQMPNMNLAVAILLCLVTGIHCCSWAYTRHTVEMVCNEKSECRYEFRQEILFDPLHREICIDLKMKNEVVGLVRVAHETTNMKCQKRVLYYTRETQHQVFSDFRCPAMGSCAIVEDTCASLQSDQFVDELEIARPYPGYSACVRACPALSCICLLPGEGCNFYRVAHVPQSNYTYKISFCADWEVTAKVTVEVTLFNNMTSTNLTLHPYETVRSQNFNVTVISMERPYHEIITRRFAIARHEGFILPGDYKLAVVCNNESDATSNFANCHSEMFCSCNAANDPVSCNCEYNWFGELRTLEDAVLPLSTPLFDFESSDGTIRANSRAGEMTLLLESSEIIDSSSRVIDQSCSVNASELVGCYSCEEGSVANFTCRTEKEGHVIIGCPNHMLTVKCDKNSPLTSAKFYFDQALVNETCQTVCNGKVERVQISGHLVFYPEPLPVPVGPNSTHPVNPFDWIDHFKFPDLNPLVVEVKNHWILATSLLGGTIALLAGTYIWGPLFVSGIVKLLLSMLKLIVQFVGFVIRVTIDLLTGSVRGVAAFVQAQRARP